MTDAATVATLYRYPVKGLPGVELSSADLAEGYGIPGDRCFAIARSGGEARRLDGARATSRTFVINVDCEGLLALDLAVSDDGSRIEITTPDEQSVTLAPGLADGLERANEILAEYLSRTADNNFEAPAIVERDGGKGYWDFRETQVSIINHASIEAVGRAAGEVLDPRRFRGNLYVRDLPAWEENGWLGQRLRIGEAELVVARGCERRLLARPRSGSASWPTVRARLNWQHAGCGS